MAGALLGSVIAYASYVSFFFFFFFFFFFLAFRYAATLFSALVQTNLF